VVQLLDPQLVQAVGDMSDLVGYYTRLTTGNVIYLNRLSREGSNLKRVTLMKICLSKNGVELTLLNTTNMLTV
jgi:hypothetical protein